MICPTCGTHIPDGLMRCPACHANIGMTVPMPALQGRWCPSCGAGAALNDEVCPHCGMPLDKEWGVPAKKVGAARDHQALEAEDQQSISNESDDTRAIPRIESAIPPEDESESMVVAKEGVPRTGAFVLAAISSVIVVCGITLAITHPWKVTDYSISATTEADTSMAGFPGTVDSLSGQDSNGRTYEVVTGDDATYAELSEAHDKLLRYSLRCDECEALFNTVAYTDNIDERKRGKRETDALAIDLSNLIEDLSQLDVTSGLYAEDLEHVTTLANWVRNRVDALAAAWKEDVASADPVADQPRIQELYMVDRQEDGQNGYKVLFDQNWEPWRPQHKESPEEPASE
ncbi:MAG: zinc ribbon domain-containing protein [Atopobiaceae bacterium]|nr:zinc ribbon domain-containing protein [Atopobiaceae bacterium]